MRLPPPPTVAHQLARQILALTQERMFLVPRQLDFWSKAEMEREKIRWCEDVLRCCENAFEHLQERLSAYDELAMERVMQQVTPPIIVRPTSAAKE
jgi:hypothetical protein